MLSNINFNMEYDELIHDIFQLECKLFMKMDSYRLIKQKCGEKCLTQDEKQLLNSEIHYVFERLIKTITEYCPSLTDNDVIFCCLTKSGLDNTSIYHSMGDVSKQPINQRKYRIKKKMKEANCNFLFELMFLPVF